MRKADRHGPVCTVVLDLTGVPWAGDAESVRRTLAERPGVLTVEAMDDARRARVSYDQTRTTLPELWNWVVGSSGAVPKERPASSGAAQG